MTLKEHGSKLHSTVGQLFYCKITSVLHFWAHEKSLIWRKRRIPLSPLALALETPMTTSHLITLRGIEEVSNIHTSFMMCWKGLWDCLWRIRDECFLETYVDAEGGNLLPPELHHPALVGPGVGGGEGRRGQRSAMCSTYRVCVVKVPKFHGTQ